MMSITACFTETVNTMPFDPSSTKIEKEKRELAKQYGMVRTEVSGGEIAEEMEKERRMFQLQMCEVRSAHVCVKCHRGPQAYNH